MPVPSSSLMKTFWKANYTYPTTQYTDEYTEKLFGEVERAWKDWQKNFKFGGLTVAGAGVGGWTGVGAGGRVQAKPYKGEVFVFYKQTDAQKKFQQSLYDTLEEVLKEVAQSINFVGVNYVGTSSATAVNPGQFQASAAPVPLKTVAPMANLSGVGDRWIQKLTPPDFNLDHPQCAAKAMANAVASAIETAFSIWTTSTTISGGTASGPAAPGGVGTGAAQFDGKLT